jgi:hypothetical protein
MGRKELCTGKLGIVNKSCRMCVHVLLFYVRPVSLRLLQLPDLYQIIMVLLQAATLDLWKLKSPSTLSGREESTISCLFPVRTMLGGSLELPVAPLLLLDFTLLGL